MVAQDVWRFALAPRLPAGRPGWGGTFAFVFAIVLTLDFAIAGGAILLEVLATEAGYEPPPYIESGLSLPWELAAMILFAPAIEEAIFRGPLAGTKAWLRFGLHMGIVIGLMIATTIFADSLPEYVMLSASVFALGVLIYAVARLRARHRAETGIPAWYRNNVRLFVWGSTLLFGGIHLWNYEGASSPLDVLLVASQTTGGLILAYTRIHLGLAAAIAQHAIFNAAFAAGSLAIYGSL